MPREIKAPPANIETATSFDGKHTLEFNEGSHRYKLNGKPCVGTTTFIKAAYPTSQGLISWQKGQALEHLWAATVNRTVDLEEKAELFKAAKLADRVKSQEAADIGTILHEFAELYSRGQVAEAMALQKRVSGLEQYKLIEACIDKFIEWSAQNTGEFVAAEGLIASPTYLYCGKFDLLSRRDGRLVLSDYKTSKGIFTEQKLQLAAYKLAITHWLGLDVGVLEVLRFGKEGGEFEVWQTDDKDEIAVLTDQVIRCRQTYEFLKTFER